MSTQGKGSAVVSNPVAAGAGLAVAGVAMAGIGVAIGGGILIYQGVTYCGKQLQKHYENSCKEATRMKEAHFAKNRANISLQNSTSSLQWQRIAAMGGVAPQGISSPAEPALNMKEQAESLAHIQRTIEDAQATLQLKDEMEKDLLVYRLRAGIEAGRGLLPASALAEAENALRGGSDTILHALEQLERAWQPVTDAQSQQTHQLRLAQQALGGVFAQLGSVDTLLYTLGETQNAVYQQRKQAIQTRAKEAEQQLTSNPVRALTLAKDAQQLATTLAEDVSSHLFEQWEGLRSKQLALQGTLTALERMVLEAIVLKLVNNEEADQLKQRIQDAQTSIQRFVNAGMSPTAQREALMLNERVALLKKDVFQRVQTSQQKGIAQTIAQTLTEVGFQGVQGDAPVLQTNGDTVRVVVKRAGHTPGFARDDKRVAFDITRDGEVSYDFSGYVGDTCVEDAKKIFTALRKNGIFILDDEAMSKLQQVPSEQVTPSLLAQEVFQPHLTRKKEQADLVDRLSRVLAQMNYQNIKKSSAGGTIEIDAFNGSIGYHIVLPSEGDVQVFKDARQKDISHDTSDPIVVEAAQKPEAEQAAEALKQDEKSRSVQQRKQISH